MLVNVNKIRGLMAENNISYDNLASELGITRNTFAKRLKNGTLTLDDAEKMIVLLKIDDPTGIFFGNDIT